MFESINNSIRKLGTFFSSPPPASTLGKRKADSDGEFEHISRVKQALSAGDADDASDEETNYYGYKPPQPPQKRMQKTPPSKITMKCTSAVEQSTAATQKANDAIRRARQIMGKVETMQDVSPKEREIQEELERQERQERQERIDRDGLFALAKNKRSPTTGKYRRKSAVSAFDDNTELSPGILKSKLVPDSSVLGKSDSSPPADEHTVGRAIPMAKWHIKPHLRARQLLEANGHDTAALLEDLQEPAYVCRDAEIRDGVCKLTKQIEDFAKEQFVFVIEDGTRLRSAFESMAPETVKIIGCVASGGPAGASGWKDLFLTADKRQALVCAIIGNVLVEQVFQHLFFGGTEDQIKEVAAIQFEHRNEDGKSKPQVHTHFMRTNTHRFRPQQALRRQDPRIHNSYLTQGQGSCRPTNLYHTPSHHLQHPRQPHRRRHHHAPQPHPHTQPRHLHHPIHPPRPPRHHNPRSATKSTHAPRPANALRLHPRLQRAALHPLRNAPLQPRRHARHTSQRQRGRSRHFRRRTVSPRASEPRRVD